MDEIKFFNKPNLEAFKEAFKEAKSSISQEPDLIRQVADKITEVYIRDTIDVVTSQDIEKLKAHYFKWGKIVYFPEIPSDKVLEITIRKMAVNMRGIPEDVKEEAKKWLLDRGYDLTIGGLENG